eukprot:scaffold326997_cov18-Prasinocladus_malaysianus.AAC.1
MSHPLGRVSARTGSTYEYEYQRTVKQAHNNILMWLRPSSSCGKDVLRVCDTDLYHIMKPCMGRRAA